MQLQGPAAHGRAAHLYIARFLAQSYNEATRNTLLPVLLSAMRLAKVVMILTKLITSQPECVCKYLIRNLNDHCLFSTCNPHNPMDQALAWEFTRSSLSSSSLNINNQNLSDYLVECLIVVSV